MSSFNAITPIDTTLIPLDFATDSNADLDPDTTTEPDPDSERLVPYEPGYVDGKGPLHEAAVCQILTTTPGYPQRRFVAMLPTCAILNTIHDRSRQHPRLPFTPYPAVGAILPFGELI